jgi:hypothetical protein
MIQRIVSVDDLDVVHRNFLDLAKEHPVMHYGGMPFLPDTMLLAWRNTNLLINRCVLVVNFTDEEHIDALCWFTIARDWRVDRVIASSYLWVSKNNKHGLQVFLECLDILKRKEVDVINVGFLLNSPSADKVERLLQKKGFIPEDKSYSLIL